MKLESVCASWDDESTVLLFNALLREFDRNEELGDSMENAPTRVQTSTAKKWLRRFAIGLGTVVLVLVTAVFITQRVSDGPIGPLQGGPFTTGELVTQPVADWSFVNDAQGVSEILLVGPGTSRITGLMLLDGDLYIPCDLGYMWNRDWDFRWIGYTLYLVKSWHKDALEDGRIEIRLDGKRYPGQAVRVTDPGLLTSLRSQLEEMAAKLVAPAPIPAAPTEPPAEIWFFRVDPRPV